MSSEVVAFERCATVNLEHWRTSPCQQMDEELLTQLDRRARAERGSAGPWPGLNVYRFSQATHPRWDGVESLSLGIIAHAGDALAAVGGRQLCGPANYVVLGGLRDFDCRILFATPRQPCFCFVLEIDPQLVRSVSGSMGRVAGVGGCVDGNAASALDDELTHTVVRFLKSLSAGGDRRVLAPLHLREMVYRILQREQGGRLMQLATHQAMRSPVAAALDHIHAHIAEPLTVETLAAQVCLSQSAFSRAFREMTGSSPYQYVKDRRLDRARQLLAEGRSGVAEVSRAVGYNSVSHFIKEFRGRFGSTPGSYADLQSIDGRARVASV